MAAEKNITSRIQQKHDTAANWAKATTFIPKKGEIVIYDAEYNTSGVQTQAVRFKIGDGSRTINNLPFVLIDPDNLAKLDAENTFTTKQTINSGYGTVSLKTQGYVEISASYASKSTIGGLFGFKDDSTGRIYAINPRDLGFVECIKMNSSSIEPGDTGTVDLGTVITDVSGKANLSGGNTFSDLQTINAPTNVSGSEQTTMKVKTSNGGAIIFGKEGANSGTMMRLDQTDGTCRLRFRSSATAGAMVWEQPESGAQLYVDLGARDSDYHRVQFPSGAGTLALTSQIPTVNNGTLTIQKNGTTVKTFSANQSSAVTVNITVPTKVSELTNDSGFTTNTGTITGIKMNGVSKGTSGVVDLGTVITESGGNITGELKLYAESGDSPRLTFQRGVLDNNLNDWSLYDSSGYLYIQQRGSGSTSWETRAEFTQSGVNLVGTISENGTALSNKYALKSDIPTFELSGDTLIINF